MRKNGLGIWTKITGQASEDFWCDSRRGWVLRTSSTQAQTRRSSRDKKTVGLASLFFPNALYEKVYYEWGDFQSENKNDSNRS